MSVKRSKIKKTHRSREISSSCSSSSASSDEETDARDLKSIKEYLSDRKELSSQLFKSVKSDKIRLMLPQNLKKIDLKELEELCANELSGMSKTRILSIINGQQMLESSETDESNDSGPSLEIISDTEEWLTDESSKKDELCRASNMHLKSVKEMSKSNRKSSSHQKFINKTKTRVKIEPKERSTKSKDTKIKIEGEKQAKKDKEGDSLLDLLELEMRARAIRALIRKEEDVIPSTSENSITLENTNVLDKKISVVKQQVMNELNHQQLENIMRQTDDEDVVLVVEPMPTIELLSTDSENEEQSQIANQKMKNDNTNQETEENIENKNSSKNVNCNNKIVADNTNEYKVVDKDINNEDKSEKANDNLRDDYLKKTKKNIVKISQGKNIDSGKGLPNDQMEVLNFEMSDSDLSTYKKRDSEKLNDDLNTNYEKKSNGGNANNTQKKQGIVATDINKVDMEEIIDLDDYPDDMDDTEDSEDNKSGESRANVSKNKSVTNVQKTKVESSETWATRYYKTDDVQNVIKESKIQSEIRKRLRERQRMCKVNKSPTDLTGQTQNEVPLQRVESNPIGSVQEYLALKANMSTDGNEGSKNTVDNTSSMKHMSNINKCSEVSSNTNDSSETSVSKGKDNKTGSSIENVLAVGLDGKDNLNLNKVSGDKQSSDSII